MPLNRDRIGHAYPSYRYEVSREKIKEYAAALGESDPRYYSDGDDCVAPPTFAACYTVIKGGVAVFSDPDLGSHFTLVHGSQAYEFGDRVIQPGDVLVCTPSIHDITYKGRNEFLDTRIDCRFADTDELAVTSTGVIVFLGSAPEVTTDAEGAA